jgi:hypothetical protein
MNRNFIGHLITSFGDTVDRTWGFMKVAISVFIGLVLAALVVKLFSDSNLSFGTFILLTAIFSLISYIIILYTFKKLKI